MLVQKIQGGLGNQMFQYAFIKALSLRNNVDFKLDLSPFGYYKTRPYELEIFNIQKNYVTKNEVPFYERMKFKNRYLNGIFFLYIKPLLFKLNKKHYKEREGKFEFDFMNKNNGYFEGYFQSENYFKDFESEIRKDFTFKNNLSKKNTDLLKSLEGKSLVSVHIRRGDYLNNPDFHSTYTKEYYDKSIKYIYDKVENPAFLFFSDDTERVKDKFKGDNYYYIDWNKGKDSRQDMALMSRCKHNIIANSSFSWWGAYLNGNSNKIIICPNNLTKIFNEKYYPEGWIKFN